MTWGHRSLCGGGVTRWGEEPRRGQTFPADAAGDLGTLGGSLLGQKLEFSLQKTEVQHKGQGQTHTGLPHENVGTLPI